jgi:hypothetical protein
MSTRALIDRLIPRASGGWNRSTGNRSLLKLVEQAQDALYQSIQNGRKWRGTDNKGFPPYLITTAGVYRYEVAAANLSCDAITTKIGATDYPVTADEILGVYTDSEYAQDYNRLYSGPTIEWAEINPYTNEEARMMVARIPVEVSPAYESTNPYITFLEDPGTTTEKFMVDFTWRAPRLTAETVPLCVPIEFEKALEDFVIGTIQESESGGQSAILQRFYTFWISEFRRKMNRGTQARNVKPQIRLC